MKASAGRAQFMFWLFSHTCFYVLELQELNTLAGTAFPLVALKKIRFQHYTPKGIFFAHGVCLMMDAAKEIVAVGHVNKNISQKAASGLNDMVEHQTTLFFFPCHGPDPI